MTEEWMKFDHINTQLHREDFTYSEVAQYFEFSTMYIKKDQELSMVVYAFSLQSGGAGRSLRVHDQHGLRNMLWHVSGQPRAAQRDSAST